MQKCRSVDYQELTRINLPREKGRGTIFNHLYLCYGLGSVGQQFGLFSSTEPRCFKPCLSTCQKTCVGNQAKPLLKTPFPESPEDLGLFIHLASIESQHFFWVVRNSNSALKKKNLMQSLMHLPYVFHETHGF